MREILFRGIDIATGEMVIGQGINMAYDTPKLFVGLNTHTVDRKTVSQFTALTDCNGVKIFEGDIVEYKPYHNLGHSEDKLIGGVHWGETGDSDGWSHGKHYEFTVGGDSLADVADSDYPNEAYCKVIGNIHQNPELLEHTNANHN